jgi:hypothetical protein
MHPLYRGIQAGSLAHTQVAVRMALDSQTREAQKETIRQMFRDGSKLLSWVLPPIGEGERNESILWAVNSLLQSTLPREKKIECLQHGAKRPRGRPSDSRLWAVYALEVKAVRPETKWEKVTELLCPCTKPGHDSCCVENLKSQVKRLRSLLRNTGLVPLIVAAAGHRTLKLNLQALLA